MRCALGAAMMSVARGEQRDAAVALFAVIPSKKLLAE